MHALCACRAGPGNRGFSIWQPCARDSGNKTATSAHGGIAERNQEPIEPDVYFKFPTIMDVFRGGGDFHHKCNTSVESPCELDFDHQITEIVFDHFDHPLH
jgi:hypothetical protein